MSDSEIRELSSRYGLRSPSLARASVGSIPGQIRLLRCLRTGSGGSRVAKSDVYCQCARYGRNPTTHPIIAMGRFVVDGDPAAWFAFVAYRPKESAQSRDPGSKR